MQAFDLVRPRDVAAAFIAAAEKPSSYIGGGTDLMQLLKDNDQAPKRLVDLDFALSDVIEAGPQGVRIGALSRMSDTAAHPAVLRDYPAISQALLASASPQVRNMATIGGNLLQRTRCGYFRDAAFACNKRVPGSGCPAIEGENRMHAILGGSDHCIATHASDLAVALAAMDAVVELHGPDRARDVAITDFHLLPGDHPEIETVLKPQEIIVALRLPPVSSMSRRSLYLKVRDRASFEWAVVSAAVALDVADDGTIRDARVALGGVGTKPWRAKVAEDVLRGKQRREDIFAEAASAAVQDAHPMRDNGFKVVLAQRAMIRALTSLV